MAIASYNIVLAIIETVAFLLNGFTLYLIGRLELKETDMWLGIAMAICDMILSGFKILEFFMLLIFGENSFLSDSKFVIPICAGLLWALLSSIACVGYLGLIRWLAICYEYRVTQLRHWWWIYVGHMIVIVILIVFCGTYDGFNFSPITRYSYPDYHASNTSALLIRSVIVITLFGCFLIINIGYVKIAKKYLNHLNSSFTYQTRAEKSVLKKEKSKVLLKIGLMLFFYNLTLLPFFIVDFIELVTSNPRSHIADVLSSQAIVCIAFVNPTMLVTMHCETWREAKKLFNFKKSSHLPIIDIPDSSISLSTYPMKQSP